MSTPIAGQGRRVRGAGALAAVMVTTTGAASDPAADKLLLVIYGLLGLAALILVGTVVFWKVTRPGRLAGPIASYSPPSADPEPVAAAAAPPRRGRGSSPQKIPASVILAELAATPPPTGAPAFDAPAPSSIPGADAAWRIEPDVSTGMLAETPTPTDFAVTGSTMVTSQPDVAAEAPPQVTAEPAPTVLPEPPPVVVAQPVAVQPAGDDAELDVVTTVVTDDASVIDAREGGPASLIAALAALPDLEPTPVHFDDPPVERVPQKRAPSGAPGFDRIARETAQQRRLEAEAASGVGASNESVDA